MVGVIELEKTEGVFMMIDTELEEVLKKAGYPYLTAPEDEWIDASDKQLTFDEMGKSHLQNCLNMLKQQELSIGRGTFLPESMQDKIEVVKELYYNKIQELADYLDEN